MAADVGALQYLPKIIGNQSLVRELCLTARRFDGVEANQIGFTSKVFDDKERWVRNAVCLYFLEQEKMCKILRIIFSMMTSVMAMAETIAQMSPVAVQGTKVNLNYARDHNIQEGLDFVVSLFL